MFPILPEPGERRVLAVACILFTLVAWFVFPAAWLFFLAILVGAFLDLWNGWK